MVQKVNFNNLTGDTLTVGNTTITTSGVEVSGKSVSKKYLQFAVDGELSTITGTARYTIPQPFQITEIKSRLGSSADSNVLLTLNKNGSTLDTITILSGQTLASNTVAFDLLEGDYLTVDINSVGTTNKGSDLSVTLTLE